MLDIEVLDPAERERAAQAVHRDGVVALPGVLGEEELRQLRAGVDRVCEQQMAEMPPESANRGVSRYSLPNTIDEPEWLALVDHPTIVPILDLFWGSEQYSCCDAGGDYSLPGAQMQPLHSDQRDVFYDPHGQTTSRDTPASFIVVNYLLDDFVPENGPTRFVPATHRSRHEIPSLEEEPQFMREALLCAPAGTAVVRDTRTWHGGTPNRAKRRVMVGVGYFAPWFRGALEGAGRIPKRILSIERYREQSPRGKQLLAELVDFDRLL